MIRASLQGMAPWALTAAVLFLAPSARAQVAAPTIAFANSANQQTFGKSYSDSVYNLTVINTVNSPTVFRAGSDYAEWTRDSSLNCWNAGSLIDPVTAKNTLTRLIVPNSTYGNVIDQGNNQWWDMIIWSTAAWNHYLVTGDTAFLSSAYSATIDTLNMMRAQHYNTSYGLFKGPSFFNDGIAGYTTPYNTNTGSTFVLDHDGTSELMCLSTNCLYYNAYRVAALMAAELKLPTSTMSDLNAKADDLKSKINSNFWISGSNRYGYYISGTGSKAGVLEDYQEGSGLGWALLFGIADNARASLIVNNIHNQPKGLPSIWPHFVWFSDAQPGRHNCIIWPQVNGIFAKGAVKRNSFNAFATQLESLNNLFVNSAGNIREVYNSISGDPDGGWQNGGHWGIPSNQTWSATAYLSMIYDGVFGMNFETNGIRFSPYLKSAWGNVSLSNLKYRNMNLKINLTGSGGMVSSFKLDGVSQLPFIPATLSGAHTIDIVMSETINSGVSVFQEGLNGYAGTTDAHLMETLSGNNSGGNDQIEVGRYSGADSDDKSGLIKFNVSSIPSNATVTSAVLEVCLTGVRNGSANKTVNIHEVTGAWAEGNGLGIDGQAVPGVSWVSKPTFDGASLGSQTIGSTSGSWYSFNIKDLANAWVNGSKANNGVMIQEDTPSASAGTKDFASSESANVSQRPRLTINYTIPLTGRTVTIQSQSNGQYVSADGAGANPLIANRATPFIGAGSWEEFNVVDLGNGYVALQSLANNLYVTDNGGSSPLIASRTAPFIGAGSWEGFQIVNEGGGAYALQAQANSKYVSTDNSAGGPLNADRVSPSLAAGSWDLFNIVAH
ncbi:DNRLRE domain-containing protein [Capsulimonas corticalis]|nr:DNRLRE domain-containing protein [Capsulimonas corticalis]